MNNIGPMIAASATLGMGYAERLLKDVKPDQFGRYATVGGQTIVANHPAFILGHLALYGPRIVSELGQDSSSFEPPAGYEDLFSFKAECLDDVEGDIYPAMEEITEQFFKTSQAAINALNSTADEVFYGENPNERMRGKFPTIGAMHGFYVGGHVMMHMGQLSTWRRMMGIGPA